MGVTRDRREIFYYDIDVNDQDDDLDIVTPQRMENVSNDQKLKKRKKRFMHNNRLMDQIEGCSRFKKTGIKRSRRGENLKYLLDLVEKDEDCEMNVEVFEPSTSVFSELFMEEEKMKVWNEFINSSEEDQLKTLQKHKRKQESHVQKNVENDSDLDESWEEIPDNRAVHPAFSAEECFQRIDKNIKSYLKRRHIPLGMLQSFESDLISFFKEWPTSVYVSKLTSSFERMMLHALCQYLDLKSRSYDHGGNRQTEVENKYQDFCPPSTLLTIYLEKS